MEAVVVADGAAVVFVKLLLAVVVPAVEEAVVVVEGDSVVLGRTQTLSNRWPTATRQQDNRTTGQQDYQDNQANRITTYLQQPSAPQGGRRIYII